MSGPEDRLRSAREAAGFETAADAARRFSWAVSTYRAHENGQNGMRDEHIVRYARAFRVSPSWLLFGSGGPDRKNLPLVGYVGAGAEIFAVDDGGALEELEPPPGIGPDAVAVAVRGQSMWPRYSEGDILIYDTQNAPDQMNGRECIVALTDGRKYVKNVRRMGDGTYDLESWNAPPLQQVEIEWVAEIKWVKRSSKAQFS